MKNYTFVIKRDRICANNVVVGFYLRTPLKKIQINFRDIIVKDFKIYEFNRRVGGINILYYQFIVQHKKKIIDIFVDAYIALHIISNCIKNPKKDFNDIYMKFHSINISQSILTIYSGDNKISYFDFLSTKNNTETGTDLIVFTNLEIEKIGRFFPVIIILFTFMLSFDKKIYKPELLSAFIGIFFIGLIMGGILIWIPLFIYYDKLKKMIRVITNNKIIFTNFRKFNYSIFIQYLIILIIMVFSFLLF